MRGTQEKWRGRTYDFYLIAHEHLCVFRKPAEGEDLKDYGYSVKWREFGPTGQGRWRGTR